MNYELFEENILNNLSFNNFTDENDTENNEIILSTPYLSHILLGVIGILVCVIGILANLTSIIILNKHAINKLSTYVYLIALSVCDAIGLFFTIIVFMQYSILPDSAIPSWILNIYPKVLVYVYPMVIAAQTLSVWIIFALTIDRYLCVCRPNLGIKFCTKRRSSIIVFTLFIVSILYSLPIFFERNYKIVNISNFKVILFSSLTAFGESTTYFRVYHLYIYTIFICLIPFGTILILNSFLIHSVIKFKRHRSDFKLLNSERLLLNNNLTNNEQEISLAQEQEEQKRRLPINHSDITILLIGLVVVFIICQLPSTILRLVTYKNREIIFNPIYVILMDVSNFLVVLNSTINCVLYSYTCTQIYPIYAVGLQ